VRDIEQKLLLHPLAPLLASFGMAGGAESASLAGKHEEALLPTVHTPDASKSTHRIAAIKILLNNILNDGTEIAVLSLKPVFVFSEKLLEVMKDHLIKNSMFRMPLTIDSCHSREENS